MKNLNNNKLKGFISETLHFIPVSVKRLGMRLALLLFAVALNGVVVVRAEQDL